MRLFDEMRGHFALLQGRELQTLGENKVFIIIRVTSKPDKPANWVVEIKRASGGTGLIYCTDILRTYLYLIHDRWETPVTSKDINRDIKKDLVNKQSISYIMRLLTTFDDVERVKGSRPYAVRYISHKDDFGNPVK